MTDRALVPFIRSRSWGANDEMVAALRREFAASGSAAEVMPLDLVSDERRLDGVRVAIVDGPDADQLALLPNLDWVQSTWAGVESLLTTLPADVAVARMIDPQLATTMAEAVLAWVLYLHRDMPRYGRQQRARIWREHVLVPAGERRIGVLGLGELGRASAVALAALGFDVVGWSRSPKTIDGVGCFHGDDGFVRIVERSDIVVNLLPLTPATTGLLDGTALGLLPAGAAIVNFGRGPTVDEDALIAALDRGHIDHAVLDVFDVEPLPDDHPFWTHERVTVLPHISGPTTTATAAAIAAANVNRWLTTGELPTHALADPRHGY